MDPFGFGTGAAGSLRFLSWVFGLLALLGGAYWLASRSMQQKAAVDRILLRLPAIGPCVMGFAMMRFCTALRLTTETALPITQAMKLSLRATGNAAFLAVSDEVVHTLRTGDDLTVALGKAGIFPEDFLSIVATAEEGGRLPEVMRQQAEYYEEEAARRLAVLTRLGGFGVWLVVASLIIYAIFQIFTAAYVNPIQNLGQDLGM
jgi:type IV pilus assembly protein PilC